MSLMSFFTRANITPVITNTSTPIGTNDQLSEELINILDNMQINPTYPTNVSSKLHSQQLLNSLLQTHYAHGPTCVLAQSLLNIC